MVSHIFTSARLHFIGTALLLTANSFLLSRRHLAGHVATVPLCITYNVVANSIHDQNSQISSHWDELTTYISALEITPWANYHIEQAHLGAHPRP